VIEATELSFSYDEDHVIDSLDLAIETGECVLICGPSGCGKTTLATCLSGIIPNLNRQGEMDGEVELDGTRTTDISKIELARKVDAVFEDPETQIIGLSVEEDVAFGCENLAMDEERIRRNVEDMLEQLGLTGYRDQDPRHLSGGEKQRLAIAAAIAKDPDLLMMDEPVSQLDPEGSEVVLDMIRRQKKRGKTILLLERKLDRAMRIADRVIALDEGTIVADTTPEQFLRDDQLMEELGMWFPENHSVDRYAPTSGTDESEYNLKAEDLWFSYISDGDTETDTDWALQEVSLEIPMGKVVGLVGHNGSGKTTLSKHLNRLYTPNHGKIWFRGEEITDKTTAEIADKVGYVFQNPDSQIFTTTVRKEVEYGPNNLGYSDVDDRVERALAQVNFDHLIDERTSKLSRGQKQRVAIASMLSLEPEVLILDEPSSGIDYRMFWEIMSEIVGNFLTPERSLVIISHDSNVVRQWADQVVEMKDGRKVRQVSSSEIPKDDHWGGELGTPADLLGESGEQPSMEPKQ